jgi:hypothetical protein
MPLDPDIQHRFAFHAATTEEKRMAHGSVRSILHDAAQELSARLPQGREKSIVLTKLEEAMFWANAAIAREMRD